MKKIVIVGGGLAGSLTAIFMAQRGYDVHVIEYRGCPQKNIETYIDKVSSRSIGVSMTVRGIKATMAAGIPMEEISACGLPVTAMSFYIGGKFRQKELVPEEDIYPLSLSRSDYQKLLNRYAIKNQVNFHYGLRVLNVDLVQNKLTMTNDDGEISYMDADLIIGTDGARSVVRDAIKNRVRRFDYHQSFFKHGYKTVILDNAKDLGLKPDVLYFYGMDSKGLFAGRAATTPDGCCSLVICLPYESTSKTISIDSTDPDEVTDFVSQYFTMFTAKTRQEIVSQFTSKPSNDFINARSSTFHFQDKAVILGDSAHATVPFLGQGMNMALEDSLELAKMIDKYGGRLDMALPAFSKARKKQADAMQDMARENYDILSSANALFFMRIKYNDFMHKFFPRHFPPNMANRLYFTSIEYSELQQIQKKQNRWYKIGRVN